MRGAFCRAMVPKSTIGRNFELVRYRPFRIEPSGVAGQPGPRWCERIAMNADGRTMPSWVVFGGVLGVVFAWISESTGHAPWAILLMLVGSLLPTFLIPLREYSLLRELCIWCFSQS